MEHGQCVNRDYFGLQSRCLQRFHTLIDLDLARDGDEHPRLAVGGFQPLETVNDFLQRQGCDVVDLQIKHLLQFGGVRRGQAQDLAEHVFATHRGDDAMLVGIELLTE